MPHDAIILGAGHNGLIVAAYLAKAGLDVLVLDRRHVAGGGLETSEDPRHPGFLHNTHSFFHRGVSQMPWFRDLQLSRFGARYVEPELNVAMLLRGGEALCWWTDFEKTVASFAEFNPRDAEELRRWRDEFLPIVEKIIAVEAMSPPLPPERRRELLGASPEGRRLLEVSRLSPLEFVERHFEHPAVRAGLLFFNGLREVDLRAPGFGHHIPFLLASPAKAQMCLGGSAALGRALVAAVHHQGGQVRLSTELHRIIVRDGRAVGVETTDGEQIESRQVVSSLNPHQTFFDLLEEADVPQPWREKAARFQYNLLAPLFALNVNLHQPPHYTAARKRPELDDALMVILGLEDVEQFHDIVRHHEAGTIPPTVMWGACPTRFDPSQAPPGKHTAFMWEKLPYRLRGDAQHWDRETSGHARVMLEMWCEYAPNLADAVIDHFARSPLDTVRTLPNMRHGDLLVGAFTGGQVGYDRPFPGAGHYRTHLDGLYLCGSCCHPGGNVTGLPGYNATQVLLADLGLDADWLPPPAEERFGLS
ncbi:MAG: NAD(P)/FAD-dependent oxidoreductase [Pirellulaceae bacterium]